MPTVTLNLFKFLFGKRCVLCSVKTTFILSTWFTSYNEKNFLQKILSPVLQSAMYNLHLQIGTYATLGGPLHLKLGFGIPITVQKCPFGKLQLSSHF